MQTGSAESGDLRPPLAPLGQGGGTASFEDTTAGEMAIETELVVDRGVDSSELLQAFDVPEFAAPSWLSRSVLDGHAS
jgi:hypothetical protein